MGANPNDDVADTRYWKEGTILYGKSRTPVKVHFLPNSNQKIGMDTDLKPYWYDRSRKIWKRIKQGGWYALRRSLRHMEKTHRGEIPTIVNIQRLCEDCNVEFEDLEKQDVGRTPATNALWVKDAARKLDRAIASLGPILDETKVEGREQIKTILLLNFRDSTGVVKKGVVRCRTATAARRFRARIQNIRAMDAWIAYYGMVVERLILAMEYHLQEAVVELGKLEGHLFAEGLNTAGRRTGRIMAAFKQYATHLAQLCHRPYRRNVRYRMEESNIILSFIMLGDTRMVAAVPTVNISRAGFTVLNARGPMDRMKLSLDHWKDGERPNGHIQNKILAALVKTYGSLQQIDLDRLPKPTKEEKKKGKSKKPKYTLRETIEDLLPLIYDAMKAVQINDWTTAYEKVDKVLSIV